MPPDLTDALAPLIALLAVGSMVLIGLKLRYDHIRQMRLDPGAREEGGRLAEDLAALRDEMRMLRQDFGEMYERVEFTERLLARGQAEGRLPPAGPRS
jgi:hypothetical protein